MKDALIATDKAGGVIFPKYVRDKLAIDSGHLLRTRVYRGKAFFPVSWQADFQKIRAAAGLEVWPSNAPRFMAISHYFREIGGYGQSAERFGPSEAIINHHSQDCVSIADTERLLFLVVSEPAPWVQKTSSKTWRRA